MKSSELRQRFIDYYKKHGHTHVKSSSLIPHGDDTLLFNNAGMNQFKNVFTGVEKRDYTRAVSSQKCVRAGGKHNDLDNVGFTARHHTFFEMLGNFSFGDYFKPEAMSLALRFLVDELGIDRNRLYFSVFETDDESFDLWQKQEGIAKDRIFRYGEKDNFWRMGTVGPCGPCTEIFYDLGEDMPGTDNVMGGEGDRFMEIWNNVFMQFFEDESGKQTPLPKPSVDTGMGLERLAVVMQNERSNYHTDLFRPLIARVCDITGKDYVFDDIKEAANKEIQKTNVACRVLADHARSTAFLIGDGVLPSNEGRGYVLRRILRRAIRYGHTLNKSQSLLPACVDQVIAEMGTVYPELNEHKLLISKTVKDEENRFLRTLEQGTQILEAELKKTYGDTLPGPAVFKLYDTYGFPADLTEIMAREAGFKTDMAGFISELKQSKELAKKSWQGAKVSADKEFLISWTQDFKEPTNFTGYESLTTEAKVIGLAANSKKAESLEPDTDGIIVLNKTTFYAEGGGQIADTGKIIGDGFEAEIIDCKKEGHIFLHFVTITKGTLKVGDAVNTKVYGNTRRETVAHHSATHLMHSALRKTLGTHVTQAGSLVTSDRLRFDFTHGQPLTKKEISIVESYVNEAIAQAYDVEVSNCSIDEAKKKGALALFGEKYADEVRVLKMGPVSMELCGGTHVSNTSEIRLFKIVSESGVSAGVRRIEALAGQEALNYLVKSTNQLNEVKTDLNINENWESFLDSDKNTLLDWTKKERQNSKDLTKQLQKAKTSQVSADDYLKEATAFTKNGIEGKLVFAEIDEDDRKALATLTDHLKDKIQSGVVIVLGKGTDDSSPLIAAVTKNLTKEIKAGDLLKSVSDIMQSRGGGRPDFAQGAAKNRNGWTEAQGVIKGMF